MERKRKSRDGLVSEGEGTSPALYDAWGNPFLVVFDRDDDNRIADPLVPGKVIPNRQVIVYSLGRDGKPGGGDDITSW